MVDILYTLRVPLFLILSFLAGQFISKLFYQSFKPEPWNGTAPKPFRHHHYHLINSIYPAAGYALVASILYAGALQDLSHAQRGDVFFSALPAAFVYFWFFMARGERLAIQDIKQLMLEQGKPLADIPLEDLWKKRYTQGISNKQIGIPQTHRHFS